jgi:hypothetical protein
MYLPVFSTGPLNLRNGEAVYEAFPWDGKKEVEVLTPEATPATEPGRVLTMQEMMEKAKQDAAAPAAPEPGRVLTMQEMMEQAKKNAAQQAAEPVPSEPQPAPQDAAAPPPEAPK